MRKELKQINEVRATFSISQIKLAAIGQNLDISAFSKFKAVVFYECDDGYSWLAFFDGRETSKGQPIITMPHRPDGKRMGFKTLAGAKRNFIKRIEAQKVGV